MTRVWLALDSSRELVGASRSLRKAFQSSTFRVFVLLNLVLLFLPNFLLELFDLLSVVVHGAVLLVVLIVSTIGAKETVGAASMSAL